MSARTRRPGAQRAQQGDGARRGGGVADRFGDLLLEALGDAGVDTRHVQVRGEGGPGGATTSPDPGWDPSGRGDLDDVLDHVDILLPTAAVLRNLARTGDPERAAALLVARGPLVAAELGASGAPLHDGVPPLHVGAPSVEAVDLTGAGDPFDAGVLAARPAGAAPWEALALAVAAGTLALRSPGGTAGRADRAEAEAPAATLGDAAREDGAAPATATGRGLASQPEAWRTAAALPPAELAELPGPGASALAPGSGTSSSVPDAWARRRQELPGAPARALTASEVDEADTAGPVDAVVVPSRVFLGTRWSLGPAGEAAIECRQAARMRTQACAPGESAHGPIALARPGTLVPSLAPVAPALAAALAPTGATIREAPRDRVVELVAVHRLAEATAGARGPDPDRPAHLNRSVVARPEEVRREAP